MKKALIISQRHPLPENNGSAMRTMNFVRSLFDFYGSDIQVDLLFILGNPTGASDAIFKNSFRLPLRSAGGYISKIAKILKGVPYKVIDFGGKEKDFFKEIVSSEHYDLIISRYIIPTQLCFSLPPAYRSKTIIDYDDILSSNLFERQFASSVGFFNTFKTYVNRFLIKRYEVKCLGFGASLFCSGSDMNYFSSYNRGRNHFVVPNIFNNSVVDDGGFSPGYDLKHTLLFVGALDYMSNVEGIEWFIRNIFPAFKRSYPDASLLVVGKSPLERVKNICRETPGVELHADVPSVKPFYEKARAVVVPLLSGSGTRIKILEAAFAGRPVLSTPIGASGLDLSDNSHILLFNGADDFNTKYVSLASVERYDHIVENARAVCIDRYSVESFNNAFHGVLNFISPKV